MDAIPIALATIGVLGAVIVWMDLLSIRRRIREEERAMARNSDDEFTQGAEDAASAHQS